MVSKFAGKNSAVVGLPRQGKSYFVTKELNAYDGGVLYINPKITKEKSLFTISDGRHKVSQVVNCVKNGMKIEYRLDGAREGSEGEVAYIIDALMKAGVPESKPILLAIDELHFYENVKLLDKKVRELAMTGVSRGVSSVFMSQRFKNINYDAVTMCENLYFFKLGAMERSYLESKKLPYEEIMKRIEQKGTYSYCVWDSHKGLMGAFKE